MSSTKSPISSGPTNAGTHNSSTAQRSWRRSLYFWMIQAWQVGEIEFQCRLARFVISKRVGIEVSLRWSKMEFERQYDEFGGKRGAPPGEEECQMSCEVVNGSADGDAQWNWGVQIQAKERRWGLRSAYAAEQPIHAEQRQTGREVKSLEWNRGTPNRGWGGDWGAPILEEERGQKRQYGALNGISKHQSRLRRAEGIKERWRGLRSADGDWGVPTGIEECRRGLRSADGDWGVPTGIEERRRGLRSAYRSGRAPLEGGGGYETASSCAIWIWWVQWLRQKCNLSPWKGKIYLDIHLEKT